MNSETSSVSSQCLDRTEFCSFFCRIDAKKDAYRTGKQCCRHNHCRTDPRCDRHSHTAAHDRTDSISSQYTKQNSDQTSDHRQDRSFRKELHHNRSCLCSERFTDTNPLVLSVTETSMIFITPIPPTSSEMPATKEIKAVTIPSISFIDFMTS